MRSLKTSLVIDLLGNLKTKSAEFSASLRSLGTSGTRSMAVFNRATAAAGRGLDALGNRYTAALSGAAGAGAVRMVSALEERLVMLKLNSNASAAEIAALRDRLFEVAEDKDLRVDPTELLGGVERIVEFTGNIKLATDNLRNIGLVMRASSADGKEIGATIADLNEKLGLSSQDDFLQAMDTLRKQGEYGKMTLADLAAQGSKLTNTFSGMGHTGVKAMREMGAWAQIGIKATSSREEATTALEALVRDIMKNAKDLEKMGIQVFDPEQVKHGRYIARDLDKIVNEIIRKVPNPAELQKIFGDEAMRPVRFLLNPDASKMLRDLLNLQGDGTELQRESAEAARTLSAALTSLNTAFLKFADANLSGPIQKTADLMNSLGPERTGTLLTAGAGVAGLTGAAVAGRKTYLGYRWLRDLFAVQKAAPIAAAATVPEAATVAAATAAAPEATAVTAGVAASGIRSTIAKLAGRAALPLAVLLAGGAAAQTLASNESGAQKTTKLSGIAGGLGGGWGGAYAGAAVGSAVLPGIGTAVGGLLGSILGSVAGAELLSTLTASVVGTGGTPAEKTARVQIVFENAPLGMRVRSLNSAPGLELEVLTGNNGVLP